MRPAVIRACLRPRMLALAAIAVIALSLSGNLSPLRPPPAFANHANGHLSDGIGFQWMAPNDYGMLTVYTPLVGSIAINAANDWRSRGEQYLRRVTVVPVSAAVYSLVEVKWDNRDSIFGQEYDDQCTAWFAGHPNDWAITSVKDTGGQFRSTDADGYWQRRAGYPFYRASICLNSDWPIDSGHVAHEIGHALGLDEVTATGAACGDTGKDSIMAYNYETWQAQWPPLEGGRRKPTREDLTGKWVCDDIHPGGVDYVYQYTTTPGYGNPVNIDVRVGYMNGTLNPVRNNGTDEVVYGMTIANFSNVAVYDVKAVILARNGTRYEVKTKSTLAAGASTSSGYTPALTYGGWADDATDLVWYGGEYYITPANKNGVLNTVSNELLQEHVVDEVNHTRVQFMEANVNPVNRNAPVTYKIRVCNMLFATGRVRPIIYSDGGEHEQSWEYLDFLECSDVEDHTEYYSSTPGQWVGFGAERDGMGEVPPEYLYQHVR